MDFEKYIKSVFGKNIDFDKVYGYQCTDFIKDYLYKVKNEKVGTMGNAFEWFKDFEKKPALYKHFIKIKNTADFVPKREDICVFNENFNKSKCGHICIATGKGNKKYFYSYDQNFPHKAQVISLIKHNYGFFYGVLRKTRQVTTVNLRGYNSSMTYKLTIPKNSVVKLIKYGNANHKGYLMSLIYYKGKYFYVADCYLK